MQGCLLGGRWCEPRLLLQQGERVAVALGGQAHASFTPQGGYVILREGPRTSEVPQRLAWLVQRVLVQTTRLVVQGGSVQTLGASLQLLAYLRQDATRELGVGRLLRGLARLGLEHALGRLGHGRGRGRRASPLRRRCRDLGVHSGLEFVEQDLHGRVSWRLVAGIIHEAVLLSRRQVRGASCPERGRFHSDNS